MNNVSQGVTTNGNGNGAHKEKESKSDSALTLLLKDVKGQKVSEADKKKITEGFKKAMSERAKIQATLDKFDAEADAIAIEMVKCYGQKHIMVDGVRYVPTSRGKRVYYKRMSDNPDVVEL